mmetsp:Transcript_59642/g.154888  ORF Transcript_59642/g.154888 Transcript_59642/m.154888 type:complete len:293 (-) Transcript_59642:124-1002(-)
MDALQRSASWSQLGLSHTLFSLRSGALPYVQNKQPSEEAGGPACAQQSESPAPAAKDTLRRCRPAAAGGRPRGRLREGRAGASRAVIYGSSCRAAHGSDCGCGSDPWPCASPSCCAPCPCLCFYFYFCFGPCPCRGRRLLLYFCAPCPSGTRPPRRPRACRRCSCGSAAVPSPPSCASPGASPSPSSASPPCLSASPSPGRPLCPSPSPPLASSLCLDPFPCRALSPTASALQAWSLLRDRRPPAGCPKTRRCPWTPTSAVGGWPSSPRSRPRASGASPRRCPQWRLDAGLA